MTSALGKYSKWIICVNIEEHRKKMLRDIKDNKMIPEPRKRHFFSPLLLGFSLFTRLSAVTQFNYPRKAPVAMYPERRAREKARGCRNQTQSSVNPKWKSPMSRRQIKNNRGGDRIAAKPRRKRAEETLKISINFPSSGCWLPLFFTLRSPH